jgi:hypothetical protein
MPVCDIFGLVERLWAETLLQAVPLWSNKSCEGTPEAPAVPGASDTVSPAPIAVAHATTFRKPTLCPPFSPRRRPGKCTRRFRC